MTGRRADAMLRCMNAETFIFIALMLVAMLGVALPVATIFALHDPTSDADGGA